MITVLHGDYVICVLPQIDISQYIVFGGLCWQPGCKFMQSDSKRSWEFPSTFHAKDFPAIHLKLLLEFYFHNNCYCRAFSMREIIQIVSANFLSYFCRRCARKKMRIWRNFTKLQKYVDGEYLVSPIWTEIEHK